MMILGSIALIAAAFAAGSLVYLAIKLTISFLKKYKKNKNSKIIATTFKDLAKRAPTMKIDDLDDDDVIIAEYDEEEDELVQDISIANDVDSRVRDILDNNDGIVVFE